MERIEDGIEPSLENGLKSLSQIMVDKISTLKIEKVRERIGKIQEDQRNELNNALKLWLNL